MNKLTSIVLTCYDHSFTARQASKLAVACITRFTNPNDYELIVVDAEPMKEFPFIYFPETLKIDRFIEVNPDPGYFACMNLGAEQAKGDTLCFVENDVFVTKDWLPNLMWYLDNNVLGAVFPHQSLCHDSYEKNIEYENLPFEKSYNIGCEEQSLVLMRKETFSKIGGWDKDMPRGYGWRRLLEQLGYYDIKYGTTTKSLVYHLGGMTFFEKSVAEIKKHDSDRKFEGYYLNEFLPPDRKGKL